MKMQKRKDELVKIKKELEKISQRNKRVEADKAWETSTARHLTIAIVTYLLIVIFLLLIREKNAWLIAIIPTAAYMLSTLSFPVVKKQWLNNYRNKRK